MADTEAKNLLAGLWADTGDRTDPEDLGLTRTTGWPVAYEQLGSGAEPERALFNQRFRELDGAFADEMRYGIGPWDADIDYHQHARATDSAGRKMIATVATGPRSGNATDPAVAGQTVWRPF